ncbi:MAG: RNA polymerase sigma factor [Myxococcota bacterium]
MRPDDERFIAEQFRTHGGAVYRRALRLLGNPEEAEEVLQDVFVKPSNNIGKLEEDTPVLNWLYRVTSNQCLDLLRQRKRRNELLEINFHPETQHDWVPEDALILQELLSRLKPEEAQAAIYAYCDGMAHHEIAEILGVSRRTVGNLLERVQQRAQKLVSATRLGTDEAKA